MEKPKHRPPRSMTHDPQLVLLAINLLIESSKTKSLPQDFINWVKSEILHEDSQQDPVKYKKSA